MFKRLTNELIINLRNVSSVELFQKTIRYTMIHNRWSMIFSSGGTNDVVYKIKYESEKEAKEAFEGLQKELVELK